VQPVRFNVGLSFTLSFLLVASSTAPAMETPPWTGHKDLEAKYHADWYGCYRDAEKTVPGINVQAGGEHGGQAVLAALVTRKQSVEHLTLACMRSLGYELKRGKK
jgi:hypothetical protein